MNSEERYKTITCIGRGAMGEVWLADDNVLKRQVALKYLTLNPTLSETEKHEATERFYREAQAAGRLSHRNIVIIYDISEIGDHQLISMEYLKGVTLDQVIAEGPQSPERAADIISQVADALAYSHSQGVVHRDIKPENVFLLPDGTVKVTDFGIARVMGSSTMTQVGAVIGTPSYMSPEQVRGDRVDSRTDIFSSGVVLYELLTGVKAFEADSITSVMYKVVHETLPPLASIRPDLPAWIIGVVERACAKDPAARYQEAAQLANDLRSHSLSVAPAAPPTVLIPSVVPDVVPAAEQDATVMRAPGDTPPPPLESFTVARRRLSAPVLAAIIAAAVLIVTGGIVTMVLLLSSSKVTMPDLEGISWEKAKSQVENLGLEIKRSEVTSDRYSPGEVIAQSPAAGQKVEKGSTVRVDVAKSGSGSASTGAGTSPSELTDIQTIGGASGSMRIRDVRHAPHDAAGFYRVVFEVRNFDGSPTANCPVATVGWSSSEGGIKVTINNINAADDTPFAGQSESVNDPIVRAIQGVSGGNGRAAFIIILSGKKPFALQSIMSTESADKMSTMCVVVDIYR